MADNDTRMPKRREPIQIELQLRKPRSPAWLFLRTGTQFHRLEVPVLQGGETHAIRTKHPIRGDLQFQRARLADLVLPIHGKPLTAQSQIGGFQTDVPFGGELPGGGFVADPIRQEQHLLGLDGTAFETPGIHGLHDLFTAPPERHALAGCATGIKGPERQQCDGIGKQIALLKGPKDWQGGLDLGG